MADEQIKVRFTGDAGDLNKVAGQATSALDHVNDAAKKAEVTWRQFVGERMGSYMKQFGGHGPAIKKIAEEWNHYKSSLSGVTAVSAQVSQAASQMAKSAATAGGAVAKSTRDLTNWGRVIQDLPFGFQGIQNNLTQLIPSVGGVGLAFTTLVTALTFAQIGFGAWTRGLGFGKKSLEDQVEALHKARQALDTYVESLDVINQARIKGLQNAQQELVSLQTLYQATQNVNIPLSERKKLVDELQDQYPKYFGNIKDEIILAGGAKKAYDELSLAIIASAKARAAQDILVDVQKQLLAVDEQITQNLRDQTKAFKGLQDARKSIGTVTGGGTAGAPSIDNRETIHQREFNGLVSEGDKLLRQRNDLLGKAAKLSQTINSITQQNPTALLDPTGGVPKEKIGKDNDDLKKLQEERRKIIEEFQKDFATVGVFHLPDLPVEITPITKGNNEKVVNFFRDQLRDAMLAATRNLPKIPLDGSLLGVDPNKPPIPLKMPVVIQAEITNAEDAAKRLQKQLEDLTARVKVALESVAIAFGEGLGDAFSGRGLDGAFRTIASVIGSFIQEIGKMLITAGIKVATFKKALDTLISNPIAKIAVGVGLVAFGQIIKNSVLPKPKGFAQGGVVFGPTMGLVGEGIGTSRANPEIIAPLDKLKDYIGQAQGGFPEYLPVVSFSYDQVRMMYKRADKQRKIFGG